MASNCCALILQDLSAVKQNGSNALRDYPYIPNEWVNVPYWDDFQFIDKTVNQPTGFIYSPDGSQTFPSLGYLLGLIATPLDTGFGIFEHYETIGGRTDINLPQAPTKFVVWLNGAGLRQTDDYSLTGTVLTLTHPLRIGDLLKVKSYGP